MTYHPTRRFPLLVVVLTLLGGHGCAATLGARDPAPGAEAPLPMAYLVGEVTPRSATLWARCGDAEEIIVDIAPGSDGALHAPVDIGRDRTARLALTALEPDTRYRYTIWCRGVTTRAPAVGTFKTPPLAEERKPVRFAWVGDVGGQNACRDRDRGYLPFQGVWSALPDFLIALGDMIYADDPCLARGRYGNDQIAGPTAPAHSLEEFRALWRYARADPFSQRAFAATSTYAIWDDHEITNDAGPKHDSVPWKPWQHLMPAAREAFLDYNPIATGDRLYRNVRWGKHLEVFILDTRSYRDANGARDDDDKTMLGAEQKAWLLEALEASNATWKVIVSSVPISIPTGSPEIGRDGWANFDGNLGFENELTEILRAIQRLTKRQVVWITTDVHFGAAIRYVPFADDSDFVFHEIITGPLNSGIFPIHDLDPTFNPQRLYMHAPARAEDVVTYADALRWYNFGTIEIDEAGSLVARIVEASGKPAFELPLRP